MSKLCITCQHWHPTVSNDQGPEHGECRYDPPQVDFIITQRRMWPMTRRTEWCGKWSSHMAFQERMSLQDIARKAIEWALAGSATAIGLENELKGLCTDHNQQYGEYGDAKEV